MLVGKKEEKDTKMNTLEVFIIIFELIIFGPKMLKEVSIFSINTYQNER